MRRSRVECRRSNEPGNGCSVGFTCGSSPDLGDPALAPFAMVAVVAEGAEVVVGQAEGFVDLGVDLDREYGELALVGFVAEAGEVALAVLAGGFMGGGTVAKVLADDAAP